jgi:hypothetical protein
MQHNYFIYSIAALPHKEENITNEDYVQQKPGSILRELIPIKTEQWDEKRPGYIEADTVAHCGGSLAGSFVYTLNVVDITTGWTSQRAGQNIKKYSYLLKYLRGEFNGYLALSI